MYKYLKKVPTPSVPDAYMVLQTGQGDCNEHAVLAASLARAVGLPSQIAVGLIYTQGLFYYHAWVTYWDGAKWFSGDPLMNRMPVPPTYVTLMYGGRGQARECHGFSGPIEVEGVGDANRPAQEVSLSR